MSQCMRINLVIKGDKSYIQALVRKYATEYNLEGLLQTADHQAVKVVACGDAVEIEAFMGALHKEFAKDNLNIAEIEPFLKDRDYRGVFRVIE
jgi:acylphosphatase